MGNEVADHVRGHRPDIPVLYMSGYAEPVLTDNGTLPDGVTILEKPFTSRELLDHLDDFLHRAAEQPPPSADDRSPVGGAGGSSGT
jgi:two-component system, cell cycle sensor histidine kinase and response regulator CckA